MSASIRIGLFRLATYLRSQVARSFLTTFAVTFLSAVPIAALSALDFSWAPTAGLAAGVAAVRTAIAALDPGNSTFGIGATASLTDALNDPADNEAIETYLAELEGVEVDESPLPDEYLTSQEG